MSMKKFKDKKKRLHQKKEHKVRCRREIEQKPHLIERQFPLNVTFFIRGTSSLSPWEEKAKTFLLGVQLSFSFNLLYMNIFGTEILCFI